MLTVLALRICIFRFEPNFDSMCHTEQTEHLPFSWLLSSGMETLPLPQKALQQQILRCSTNISQKTPI